MRNELLEAKDQPNLFVMVDILKEEHKWIPKRESTKTNLKKRTQKPI
jgi:hypothetical protein